MNLSKLYTCSTVPGATLFLVICGMSSAHADGEHGVRPLFASHETMTVTIAAPFRALMRDRDEEEYYAGTFSYRTASEAERTLDLKLRTRGRYRRQKDVCDFAPIRLNFQKKEVAGTVFEGQDKLKLVTHCSNWKRLYEQLVLKEYLSYRLLQLLTDRAFGVRLMQITYVDTDTERTRTKYGFVIEDKDHLAERLGIEYLSAPQIAPDELNRAEASLVSLFQYMIGNTDFSMIRGARNDDCCHNIVLFRGATGAVTPVPYDFDFAGIVDAPYAAPNPKYRLDKVTDRLYLGLCSNNDLLDDTIARFREREGEVRQLIESIEGMSGNSRRATTRFIGEFYKDINDARTVERELVRGCASAQDLSPNDSAIRR